VAASGAQKNGIHLRQVQRKLVSSDPRRHAILARLRAVWRHLPSDGVLLFFDVQPIVVKAYGGRRFTAAKRLVLPRPQKTRGRFYLFSPYDVRSGRLFWDFLPGKSAEYVCRFMRRVRRGYPDPPVGIGLDQDPSHPRKCRLTRQTMRELKLHWISLPKGSPDDNPVEVIFSDVQLRILDTSNDPDARTLQGQIRQHLRRRNRRRDRHICIPYLLDSHRA
jgi:transposase